MNKNATAAAVEDTAPKVLNVSVRPIEPKGKLIGFATVTLALPGGQVTIPDFRVYNGENGLFVGNPSKQDSTSRSGYRETARVSGDELQTQLNVAARESYVAEVEKLQARAAAVAPPEQPRIKDQLEKAGQEAAKHNAQRTAPEKVKEKASRDDR